MRTLRELVDEARGGMSLGVVALELGWSSQRLSQKLTGGRGIKVPEVIAIAQALHIDPMEALVAAWPEIDQVDRLAGIRRRLEGANDDEIAMVESFIDSLKPPRPAQGRAGPAAG